MRRERPLFDIPFEDFESCWANQAALVHQYGRQLADDRYALNLAKRRLEEAEARTADELRRAAQREQNKLTEKRLEELVALEPAVAEAKKKLDQAQRTVDYDHALINGLTDRKHTLQAYTQMMILAGTAEPRVRKLTRQQLLDEAGDES